MVGKSYKRYGQYKGEQMKDEIEKILDECYKTGQMIGLTSELNPIDWEAQATDFMKLSKTRLMEQWTSEILQLFQTKIDSCEDEITNMVKSLFLAEDIINIIKGKVNE